MWWTILYILFRGDAVFYAVCFLDLDDGRKDTYGVYAEPVDPEEVRGFFFV